MSITLKMMDGDLFFDRAGQAVTVEGLEKASQDMAESLINNYDSEDSPHYNGSEFYKMIGEAAQEQGDLGISSRIERYATESIERLMDLQQVDPYVDDDELIEEIRTIYTEKEGPMSWMFIALCITSSEDVAPVGFVISLDQQLPGTITSEDFATLGDGTFL
jgi:hypothetical protein